MKKLFIIPLFVVLITGIAFADQGDGLWTRSNTSAYQVAGDKGSALTVAFPYDTNAQPIVMAFEAKGINAADELVFYVRDGTGSTLSSAFCGGTTTFAHITADISGSSFYTIDSGSGNVGYFEPSIWYDANLTANLSATSSFSTGPVFNSTGHIDLSGVTFGAGSRVYKMKPAGRQIIANTTVAKDNESGLIAAPKGSTLLIYFEPVGSSAAFRINYVTVKYE
jgi:hypothetical protein